MFDLKRALSVAYCCIAILGLSPTLLGEEKGSVEFKYPLSVDYVILEYTIHSGMLLNSEPAEYLRIRGDGTVEVYIQPGLKSQRLRRGGHYQSHLPDTAIQHILNDIVSLGIIGFDEARTRAQREAVRKGQAATDVSPIQIVLNVEGIRSGGDQTRAFSGPIRKELLWEFRLSQEAEWTQASRGFRPWQPVPRFYMSGLSGLPKILRERSARNVNSSP